MRLMKKIAAAILSVCLIVPCFSVMVSAAEGTLQFTDPEATQGKTVDIEGVVRGGGSALGNISITMVYDTNSLEFVSGDNVTGSAGTITYSAAGDGNETEIRFQMRFNVLAAGETVVTATESTATLSGGDSLNLSLGTSTVKAAEGDGTTAYETPASGTTENANADSSTGAITVNDIQYELSDSFTDADVPEGYEETTNVYEGVEHRFVKNTTSGITLGYLVNTEGTGAFFLYNESAGTFSPFVVLYISDTTQIVLLSEVSDITLPSQYQAMQLTVNDQVFPAWQDMNHDGFYIIYALDGQGEKSLYQYDNMDGTYQRFFAPAVSEKEKKTGFIEQVKNFVTDNFLLVLLVSVVVIALFILILIILIVKIHHRNSELDELYEEYNIPDDLDSEPKGKKKLELDEDDYYLDDEDDEYEDDEYEDDEYENDEYEDDEFEDDEYEDDNQYEYEDDDSNIENRKKKNAENEDYNIDFIDI